MIPHVESILGRRVTLRIVGGGAGLDELKQLAHKYGVYNRIIFTGRVSDEELLEAYQHCGVFCMPSTGEGFGLVYAEAEACARPVVVSTYGGAPETVKDGETGFLADPTDIQANARALAKILGDRALAEEMGRKGRLLAEKAFSPKTFEQNVLKVIAEDM
jgi:phosphatidylinositol alpha-1,6-mannosyltransferase